MLRSLSLAALIAATIALPSLRAQQQPSPHDSVRGAVRTVDMGARTLEVVTGVGYAMRLVRLEVPAEVPIAAAGVATLGLGDLKPGDIVEATFGGPNFVAYSIRRVGRMETGPGKTP